MCGITGYISEKSINKDLFELASSSIIHRGPDNHQMIFDRNSECGLNLALGHNRLSIIDLNERANQPFIDGNQILVFNGEIYNYKILKSDLIEQGIHFETESDTELLIKYYKCNGIEKLLNSIEGMFAFFIYDADNDTAFLARDKFGIKPLLFYDLPDGIFFSSEQKAIKKYFENTEFNISDESTLSFFHHRYGLEPETIYQEIKMLQAGHYIAYDLNAKQYEIKKYWSLNISDQFGEEKFAIDRVEELLISSIKKHLISDVPVAVAFSGGLDSSLICAIAKQINPNLVAFTLDRGTHDIDTYYAKKIAEYLGLNMRLIPYEKNFTNKEIEHLFRIYDQPMGCSSIFSTYLLYKGISELGFKVALCGDGGDELFGGYTWYKEYLHSMGSFYNILFHTKSYIKNNILLNYSNEFDRYKKIMLNRFSEKELYHITGLDATDTSFKMYEGISADLNLGGLRNVKDLMAIDFHSFLKFALLRADFSSMAHSVEARVPFLNTGLVDFAFKISPSLITKNNTPKYILKKVAERYFPKELIYRPKKGFSSPVTKILPVTSGQEFQQYIFKKWKENHYRD